jgi:hypothetical protein
MRRLRLKRRISQHAKSMVGLSLTPVGKRI